MAAAIDDLVDEGPRGDPPKRLGALLRQIGQMLAEPVLYIDDIALGTSTFKPQEKSLARANGEEIALTDREVDILAYLARYQGLLEGGRELGQKKFFHLFHEVSMSGNYLLRLILLEYK